jgi:hypothetical protein
MQFFGTSAVTGYETSNQACANSANDQFVVNDRRVLYPRLIGTGYAPGIIPFPFKSAFLDCTSNNPAPSPNCVAERGNFRSNLISFYQTTAGYAAPSPIANYDAHHVLPLAWGGTNTNSNGVLVANGKAAINVHKIFNAWWCYFSLNGENVTGPGAYAGCPSVTTPSDL